MNQEFNLGRTVSRLLLGLFFLISALATAQAQNVFVSSLPVQGVTIAAVPADSNNVSSGVTNFSLTYAIGVVVILTAPATFNGEVFSNWTLNGVNQGPSTSVQFNTAGGPFNAVAVYTTPNVALTVSSINPNSGVSVTAAPPDNAALTGGTTTFVLNYVNLTTVTLTAPPGATGNPFSRWIINGVAQPIGQVQATFQMQGPATAAAVYGNPSPILIQSVNPAAGVPITASPPDASGATSGATSFTLNYAQGVTLTLTAPPSAGLSTFANWTINGVAQPAGQLAITFNVPAPNTFPFPVAAVYQTPNYTITASAVGTHGTINPSGTVGEAAGANQLFTATPNPGWMVKQWTLDGVLAQNGGNTFQLNRIVANHTLTVSFTVIIVFHPADTNKDGLMTIGEVTAYASAWKRGLAWPTAPSPIPQTYVTNAILLWKSGEAYTNDPSKAVPDFWIPIALAPSLAKPDVGSTRGAGTSVATIIPQADGWSLVNITVVPPSGAKGITLEEHLPRGAQVASLSPGGVLDTGASVIRWGPYLDAGTRILTYRVKLTTGTLSGAASFDGSSVKTTGDRSLGGKS